MIYTQIVKLLMYGDLDGSQKLLSSYLKKLSGIKDIHYFLLELNAFLFLGFSKNESSSYENLFYTERLVILSTKKKQELLTISNQLLYAYANTNNQTPLNPLVKEVITLVNKNYYDNPSLKSIAYKLAVDENYLCRIFQKETGFTYSQYLNLRKIHFAKKILEKTDKKLSYIADFCGFSSPSHFSTVFKKYTKMSPRDYRRFYRKQ